MIDILRQELYEIVNSLQLDGIKLIIGGGYGLVLRIEFIENSGIETLMELPETRSTNDLDIFLQTEIMVNDKKLKQVRSVLEQRNYRAITGAEYLQFVREIRIENVAFEIKIDFLTRKIIDEDLAKNVKQDERRVKYRKEKIKLHAHTTPEALTVEEYLTEVNIGKDDQEQACVYLPHPFSYLLLKLFAVRDCINSDNPYKQEKAGYHATDLYRILASITEEELKTAKTMKERLNNGTPEEQGLLIEAKRIVGELFNDIDSGALLKVRQTFGNESKINVEMFRKELKELF